MFLKWKLRIIIWKLCQVSFETGASGKCGSCPVHIHGRDPKTARPTAATPKLAVIAAASGQSGHAAAFLPIK